MDKQKVSLLVLIVVLVLGVLTVIWSFRSASPGTAQDAQAQKAGTMEYQVGAVQNNPNVPPQVKQWLEYNMRQQGASGSGYGR